MITIGVSIERTRTLESNPQFQKHALVDDAIDGLAIWLNDQEPQSLIRLDHSYIWIAKIRHQRLCALSGEAILGWLAWQQAQGVSPELITQNVVILDRALCLARRNPNLILSKSSKERRGQHASRCQASASF